MSAFAPSPQLPLAPRHLASAQTRRRTRTPTRHPVPRLSLAETPNKSLKNRSVIALRGLSDLGSVTVLHELTARLALPTTLSAYLQTDSQLLLGGLIGIWTAARVAERLHEETTARISETRDLPARWDAAFVYTPALAADEVADAVTWLHAFDELEGVQARELLRGVATDGAVTMRVRLAYALAAVPVASNVVDAILTHLLTDHDAFVRQCAHDALTRYHRAPHPLPVTPLHEDAQLRAVLDGIFLDARDPVDQAVVKSGVLDRFAQRVERFGCVALTRPDLCQIAGGDDVIDVVAHSENVDVPLFEGLRWSELLGLCALALVPAGYELLSMADGGDLPLRFVGLGWLLTMGGLAAYPQSGMLWRRFAKTVDGSHREQDKQNIKP